MADLVRPRLQSLSGTILSHRVILYSLASTVAVSATVANALQNHSNFYSVTVYLAKSGGSVLVLANFGLLIALVCGRLVQQIFFGALRAVEVERLYDRMWFFVTESLLAFTIFRDEFDIPFTVMFGFLLFVKSFHWLMADRIEWMNQMPFPGPPALFHIRINGLFLVLWMTNVVMFAFAVESVLTNGVGAIVLFASEYAILMASASNSMAKYVLSAYEFRHATVRGGENAPPWENKSMWVFYVDLATDFLKLITYLAFFAVVITFYGVPLNVIRDVYVTARSFITRLRDLMRYRTATRNMDERYPNATQEEMSAMSDRTCIICREEMVLSDTAPTTETSAQNPGPAAQREEGPNTTPKKLPCGHVFHFHCLRSWLERQQSCPTCRRGVLDPPSPPQAAERPGQPAPARGAPGQPGAIPPVGNPFGPRAEAQQPPASHLLNFVRSLFGGPLPQQQQPPPPNMPLGAQLAQVNGQLPQNFGWGIHPQGIPIPPQAQQHLQPPPMFPGFWGPNGVWQQWVADPRLVDAAQQAAPTQPQHQSAPISPTSPPDAPTSATTAPETRSGIAEAPATPLPEGGRRTEDAPQPSTPRDAAASAALRRTGSGPATSSHTQPARGPSNTTSPPATSPTPSVSSPPASASAATPAPSASPPRADVPSLIPLYNLSLGGTQRPTIPQGAPPAYRGPDPLGSSHPMQSPLHLPQQWRPPGPPINPTPVSFRAPLYAPRNDLRMQGRGVAQPYQTPLSQLPPTLTEEQLRHLDVATREAIDERLRVLEGVSSAIYRCVEELTRMRSVLPPSPVPSAFYGRQSFTTPQAPPSPSHPGSSSSATAPTPTVPGQAAPVESSADKGKPALDEGFAGTAEAAVESGRATSKASISDSDGSPGPAAAESLGS